MAGDDAAHKDTILDPTIPFKNVLDAEYVQDRSRTELAGCRAR